MASITKNKKRVIFTAASTNWKVPEGIYSIKSRLLAGGGAGGQGDAGGAGGAGGSSSGYIDVDIEVTPGETLIVEAPLGGQSNAARGGDARILRGSTVLAYLKGAPGGGNRSVGPNVGGVPGAPGNGTGGKRGGAGGNETSGTGFASAGGEDSELGFFLPEVGVAPPFLAGIGSSAGTGYGSGGGGASSPYGAGSIQRQDADGYGAGGGGGSNGVPAGHGGQALVQIWYDESAF